MNAMAYVILYVSDLDASITFYRRRLLHRLVDAVRVGCVRSAASWAALRVVVAWTASVYLICAG
jgi:catechol 2,3-dioxygenase-like lactoylglutathione lyase family enzyme